jgi:replicative DNA helicase
MNVEAIKSRCRKIAMESGLIAVVIDYLQLMDAPKDTRRDNRERQIAETTRGLKIMARDLQVPVIALSQLNRDLEKRQDKHPQLSDLRESGAIEQDADIIMFLYRAAVYAEPGSQAANDTNADLDIAKHRNGPTGRVKLYYQKEFTKFQNLTNEEPISGGTDKPCLSVFNLYHPNNTDKFRIRYIYQRHP